MGSVTKTTMFSLPFLHHLHVAQDRTLLVSSGLAACTLLAEYVAQLVKYIYLQVF